MFQSLPRNAVLLSRLPVHFCSQQLENFWEAAGFPSPEEARAWAPKSCGVVCLKSVLLTLSTQGTPSVYSLLQELLHANGFKSGVGWVHAALATQAQKLGISAATQRAHTVKELALSLMNNDLVVASVAVGFEGGKGGHLVLVKGFATEDTAVVRILVDHPSCDPLYEKTDLWIEAARFERHFSGNIILFRAS